jgi:hypothetical protein
MSMAILMNIEFSFSDALLPFYDEGDREEGGRVTRPRLRFCHSLSAARNGDLSAG